MKCMALEHVWHLSRYFSMQLPQISHYKPRKVCVIICVLGIRYNAAACIVIEECWRCRSECGTNRQTIPKRRETKKTMHINDWKASLSWCIQREKEEKKKSINTHSKLLRFNPIFQRNFIRTASGKMYFDFMWNALNEFYALPRCVCASKLTPPTICAKQINDSEHMRHRDMKNAYIFVRESIV